MEKQKVFVNTDLFQVLPNRAQQVVLAACMSGTIDELIRFRKSEIQPFLERVALTRGIEWLSASGLIRSIGEEYWLNPTIAYELRGNPWVKWVELLELPF